jgi:hypothetical protein
MSSTDGSLVIQVAVVGIAEIVAIEIGSRVGHRLGYHGVVIAVKNIDLLATEVLQEIDVAGRRFGGGLRDKDVQVRRWLSNLVRSSLRLRPDRIPIGEVRRGAEALDLLKAWGTGHPGGVGAIHAGSTLGALRRMEQLIQEAVVTVPRALIAETIQFIAVLAGRGSNRRLAELARVEGLGPNSDYVLHALGDQP